MIVSINSVTLDIPLLMLRICEEQPELSTNFDSVLLTRFAKKYNVDESPNFLLMPINKMIDRVFVIEDFLELFELKTDCTKLIMEGYSLPVDWYGDSFEYKTKGYSSITGKTINNTTHNARRKNKIYVKDCETLVEDWVYIVSHYDSWANMFSG